MRTNAAAALFGQFETVFYTKADLLVTAGGYKQLPEQGANALRLPFADLLGGLDSLDERASREVLGHADGVLIGAKDFRPPAALGDVQSHFCYIVVLANRRFTLAKAMGKFSGASLTEASIWKWSVKPTEGQKAPVQFYATQVADSYVLVSNSLDDLRPITQKLASPNLTALSSVRDWESLNQHELWGYRSYRQSEAGNKMAAGLSEVAPGAEALTFFADLKQKNGVLRLFSSGPDTAQNINSKNALPRFNEVNKGVWETGVPLATDQTIQQMTNVMGLFGFAIYL